MRWTVFAVVAFVFIALDRSLMNLFTLPSLGSIAPNIVLCLVAYLALFASKPAALGAAFLLGIAMDLTSPLKPLEGAVALHLIGPNALGYLFASYLVVQVRTMVFRQRVVTISILTAASVIAAALIAITIYVIRSWYGEPIVYPTQPSAIRELIRHGGIALYSGVAAVVFGWALLASTPVWGFQWAQARRSVARR